MKYWGGILYKWQGIYISRILLVEALFVKLKYFVSIKKILATAAIRENKIEMENESQFVKYTTLENNHLHVYDSTNPSTQGLLG